MTSSVHLFCYDWYCPAQAGLAVYGESPGAISQIEDSLITGVLRERLPQLRIEMLEAGSIFCKITFSIKNTEAE